MGEKFLLDTNTFVTSFQSFYALPIAPSFWEKFGRLCTSDPDMAILDMVKEEIAKGNDELPQWIQAWTEKGLTVLPRGDAHVIEQWRNVLAYIQESPLYNQKALYNWSVETVADPWIIAAAKVYGYTVITFEKSSGHITNPTKNPKIPDVCAYFGVPCQDLFYLMRQKEIVL